METKFLRVRVRVNYERSGLSLFIFSLLDLKAVHLSSDWLAVFLSGVWSGQSQATN